MRPEFNFLDQPNAQKALENLVAEITHRGEKKNDQERRRLRSQIEELVDELGIGTESLMCAVKEKRAEHEEAKAKLREKSRALVQAERALEDYRRPLLQKIGRLETQIAKKPMQITTRLYHLYIDVARQLGASPSWALDSDPKRKVDDSYWVRADALGRIKTDIEQLDACGDLCKAELLERAIRRRLTMVMQ